ncbi:DsbA family protein [Novosphingobium sp.]|uniref:DsbA family protein n=1 Tax=Novosphingobium sp. TaxID=1874826 RepID=UPI0031D53582
MLKFGIGIAAVAALAALGMAGTTTLTGKASAEEPSAERARLQQALENDPALPSVAPQGYDVTVVVFADYQCQYCRKLHPELAQLMARDRKVRIVYRDWPIFGPMSQAAARAAMASQYQGKHAAFDDAIARGPVKLNADDLRRAADASGVNWARLQADLKSHGPAIDAALKRTDHFARLAGLSGTPGIIIGHYLLPGAVDLATLQSTVEAVRHNTPLS